MKDADDLNSLSIGLIEDHMLSFFHAAKPRFYGVTAATDTWIFGD
jgi:hypothetical protein